MAYNSHLTISQYRTLTGLPLVGVNDVYVDYKIKMWSKLLDNLTTQNWATRIETSQRIDINICQELIFKFTAYQEAGLIISVRKKKSTTWTTLTKDLDYKFIYPIFETKIDGEVVANPVVGLDFRCYKCLCECEELEIKGLKYWYNGLPDDLLFILTDLLDSLLKIDTYAYTSGIIPDNIGFNNIKRESDQTRSIEMDINTNAKNTTYQKIEENMAYAPYWSTIEQYAVASLKLYGKFKM